MSARIHLIDAWRKKSLCWLWNNYFSESLWNGSVLVKDFKFLGDFVILMLYFDCWGISCLDCSLYIDIMGSATQNNCSLLFYMTSPNSLISHDIVSTQYWVGFYSLLGLGHTHWRYPCMNNLVSWINGPPMISLMNLFINIQLELLTPKIDCC